MGATESTARHETDTFFCGADACCTADESMFRVATSEREARSSGTPHSQAYASHAFAQPPPLTTGEPRAVGTAGAKSEGRAHMMLSKAPSVQGRDREALTGKPWSNTATALNYREQALNYKEGCSAHSTSPRKGPAAAASDSEANASSAWDDASSTSAMSRTPSRQQSVVSKPQSAGASRAANFLRSLSASGAAKSKQLKPAEEKVLQKVLLESLHDRSMPPSEVLQIAREYKILLDDSKKIEMSADELLAGKSQQRSPQGCRPARVIQLMGSVDNMRTAVTVENTVLAAHPLENHNATSGTEFIPPD